MRIAFVATPIIERTEGRLASAFMDKRKSCPHLAPYLLAAILNDKGYHAQVVDLVCRDTFDESHARELAEYHVVLLSANSINWPGCAILIRWLKEISPETILVVGGIHATFFGEDILTRFPVDYIICGEGETAVVPLMEAIHKGEGWEKVPGLMAKDNSGAIAKNTLALLLKPEELPRFPKPLFDQLPENHFDALPIESARGCVGNCAFCAIPYKKKWRPLAADAFVDRLESIQPYLAKVQNNYYNVVDDCFTVDRKRIIDIIATMEKRGINNSLIFDARVIDMLDEELVERIVPYVHSLLVGAESFLENSIRLIRKPVNREKIINCAKNVYKYGIADKTVFSFIIGFPWETKSEIRENINWVSELALYYGVQIYLQWFSLIPGSAIWQSFLNQGKVSVADIDEVGYLFSKNLSMLSTPLSIEDQLEIADIVFSVRKILHFSKDPSHYGGEIFFTPPIYLLKEPQLAEKWVQAYQEKMYIH